MHKANAVAAILLILLGAGAAGAQETNGEALPRPYRIECGAQDAPVTATVCRVDVATYVGWRVFHAQCASCHAADALGSSFAPDLTRRMQGMDERAFFAALDHGYLGPDDPTPPRGANPDVVRYYGELWSYLNARATGALPPGPLERLPNAGFADPD